VRCPVKGAKNCEYFPASPLKKSSLKVFLSCLISVERKILQLKFAPPTRPSWDIWVHNEHFHNKIPG
jgi:hypothetical protein